VKALAIGCGLVVIVAALAAQAQKKGPQVGAPVPDFTLVDQSGATHTLKSILGPNGAILVFFRSADW
jgi:hypothetical protein